MDHSQDLYAILGIARTADSSEVKQHYRQLARRFHPDTNPNPAAARQFRDVSAAYEVLGDELKRADYDRMRNRMAPDPEFLSLQLTPSKRLLPSLREPQVVYVLLQIQAQAEAQQGKQQTTPMNLALVLDRSTSMRGARLDRVKIAAHQIIDQMAETDYLSLVAFSDRADPLIRSERVVDKASLKSSVNMMSASGGTEIFQGLSEAMTLIRLHQREDYVNHIILLTDGETFDRHELSLELAEEALKRGVGISTMGIGEEWNDDFLDEIATKTGGYCAFINSPGAVVRFLNERVRSLGAAYAERLQLSVATDPDVRLEALFKMTPNPQPVNLDEASIPLGLLEYNRPLNILAQMQVEDTQHIGPRPLIRFDLTADILREKRSAYRCIQDLVAEVSPNPSTEVPPRYLLDALGKLTLYRMQQRAEAALQAGNYEEATRRLETFATRLLQSGQPELASTVRFEASRLKETHNLSAAGHKTIKFGTRMLFLGDGGGTEA